MVLFTILSFHYLGTVSLTHWIGKWVGPRVSLGDPKNVKLLAPTGIKTTISRMSDL